MTTPVPRFTKEIPKFLNFEVKSTLPPNTEKSECTVSLRNKLEKIGMIDSRGILLFKPPYIKPLDNSCWNRLKAILDSPIEKGSFKRSQEKYLSLFDQLFENTFKVGVLSYLRGGYAFYVVNIADYLNDAVNDFCQKMGRDPSFLKEEMEILIEEWENRSPPLDIDWIDLFSEKIAPEEIKKVILNYMNKYNEGAFSALLVPTKKALFPEPGNYIITSIENGKIKIDRVSGKVDKTHLFSLDDIRIPIRFQTGIRPTPEGDYFWQTVIDRLLYIVRLSREEHLSDFRSLLAAIQHLSSGATIDERNCSLNDIGNHIVGTIQQFPEALSTLLNGIKERVRMHQVDPAAFLLNIYIQFLCGEKDEKLLFSLEEVCKEMAKEFSEKKKSLSVFSEKVLKAIQEHSMGTLVATLYRLGILLTAFNLKSDQEKISAHLGLKNGLKLQLPSHSIVISFPENFIGQFSPSESSCLSDLIRIRDFDLREPLISLEKGIFDVFLSAGNERFFFLLAMQKPITPLSQEFLYELPAWIESAKEEEKEKLTHWLSPWIGYKKIGSEKSLINWVYSFLSQGYEETAFKIWEISKKGYEREEKELILRKCIEVLSRKGHPKKILPLIQSAELPFSSSLELIALVDLEAAKDLFYKFFEKEVCFENLEKLCSFVQHHLSEKEQMESYLTALKKLSFSKDLDKTSLRQEIENLVWNITLLASSSPFLKFPEEYLEAVLQVWHSKKSSLSQQKKHQTLIQLLLYLQGHNQIKEAIQLIEREEALPPLFRVDLLYLVAPDLAKYGLIEAFKNPLSIEDLIEAYELISSGRFPSLGEQAELHVEIFQAIKRSKQNEKNLNPLLLKIFGTIFHKRLFELRGELVTFIKEYSDVVGVKEFIYTELKRGEHKIPFMKRGVLKDFIQVIDLYGLEVSAKTKEVLCREIRTAEECDLSYRQTLLQLAIKAEISDFDTLLILFRSLHPSQEANEKALKFFVSLLEKGLISSKSPLFKVCLKLLLDKIFQAEISEEVGWILLPYLDEIEATSSEEENKKRRNELFLLLKNASFETSLLSVLQLKSLLSLYREYGNGVDFFQKNGFSAKDFIRVIEISKDFEEASFPILLFLKKIDQESPFPLSCFQKFTQFLLSSDPPKGLKILFDLLIEKKIPPPVWGELFKKYFKYILDHSLPLSIPDLELLLHHIEGKNGTEIKGYLSLSQGEIAVQLHSSPQSMILFLRILMNGQISLAESTREYFLKTLRIYLEEPLKIDFSVRELEKIYLRFIKSEPLASRDFLELHFQFLNALKADPSWSCSPFLSSTKIFFEKIPREKALEWAHSALSGLSHMPERAFSFLQWFFTLSNLSKKDIAISFENYYENFFSDWPFKIQNGCIHLFHQSGETQEFSEKLFLTYLKKIPPDEIFKAFEWVQNWQINNLTLLSYLFQRLDKNQPKLQLKAFNYLSDLHRKDLLNPNAPEYHLCWQSILEPLFSQEPLQNELFNLLGEKKLTSSLFSGEALEKRLLQFSKTFFHSYSRGDMEEKLVQLIEWREAFQTDAHLELFDQTLISNLCRQGREKYFIHLLKVIHLKMDGSKSSFDLENLLLIFLKYVANRKEYIWQISTHLWHLPFSEIINGILLHTKKNELIEDVAKLLAFEKEAIFLCLSAKATLQLFYQGIPLDEKTLRSLMNGLIHFPCHESYGFLKNLLAHEMTQKILSKSSYAELEGESYLFSLRSLLENPQEITLQSLKDSFVKFRSKGWLGIKEKALPLIASLFGKFLFLEEENWSLVKPVLSDHISSFSNEQQENFLRKMIEYSAKNRNQWEGIPHSELILFAKDYLENKIKTRNDWELYRKLFDDFVFESFTVVGKDSPVHYHNTLVLFNNFLEKKILTEDAREYFDYSLLFYLHHPKIEPEVELLKKKGFDLNEVVESIITKLAHLNSPYGITMGIEQLHFWANCRKELLAYPNLIENLFLKIFTSLEKMGRGEDLINIPIKFDKFYHVKNTTPEWFAVKQRCFLKILPYCYWLYGSTLNLRRQFLDSVLKTINVGLIFQYLTPSEYKKWMQQIFEWGLLSEEENLDPLPAKIISDFLLQRIKSSQNKVLTDTLTKSFRDWILKLNESKNPLENEHMHKIFGDNLHLLDKTPYFKQLQKQLGCEIVPSDIQCPKITIKIEGWEKP